MRIRIICEIDEPRHGDTGLTRFHQLHKELTVTRITGPLHALVRTNCPIESIEHEGNNDDAR